jgi:hypothetical protein
MRILRAAVLLLLASSVLASPVITSITPSEGPVSGGTRVIIRGSGFNTNCIVCSPPIGEPEVMFGLNPATGVHVIDETTIEAITPRHLPGPVNVSVRQLDGSDPNVDTLVNGYNYVGDASSGFDAILFPIFMPPVQGAFGSEFHTTPRVASRGEQIDLYGVDRNCVIADAPRTPTVPFTIGSGPEELWTVCSQSVGRIFYVPEGRGTDLVANLRVTDVSRQHASHGVEIPVVRADDFTTEKIVLLGVPIDARFRNTLRVYGMPGQGSGYARVVINGTTHPIALNWSGDMFEPMVATFTDFPRPDQLPAGQKTITVTIELPPPAPVAIVGPTPIWAFVSVTNNETQEITTVTPN